MPENSYKTNNYVQPLVATRSSEEKLKYAARRVDQIPSSRSEIDNISRIQLFKNVAIYHDFINQRSERKKGRTWIQKRNFTTTIVYRQKTQQYNESIKMIFARSRQKFCRRTSLQSYNYRLILYKVVTVLYFIVHKRYFTALIIHCRVQPNLSRTIRVP